MRSSAAKLALTRSSRATWEAHSELRGAAAGPPPSRGGKRGAGLGTPDGNHSPREGLATDDPDAEDDSSSASSRNLGFNALIYYEHDIYHLQWNDFKSLEIYIGHYSDLWQNWRAARHLRC